MVDIPFPGPSFPPQPPNGNCSWPANNGASSVALNASDFLTKTASGHFDVSAAKSIGFSVEDRATIASISIAQYGITFGGAYTGLGGPGVALSSFYGLIFATGGIERWRMNSSGNFVPSTTNSFDLGAAGTVVRNIYSQNAVTITSDKTLKKQLGGLSEAEVRAGLRIVREMGWWQWLSSISDKGKQERTHFGPMAQDIGRAFVDEGIEKDWGEGRPSFMHDMLCYDEWDEVTEPIMETRTIKRQEVRDVLLGQDADGNDLYRKVTVEVEDVETYDTGETKVVTPAGKGWRIDPTQLSMFLIACVEADQNRRLAALEAVLSGKDAQKSI